MPESVRDVIVRRVDRLGEDARVALTLAAVIRRSFDVERVEVAGRDRYGEP